MRCDAHLKRVFVVVVVAFASVSLSIHVRFRLSFRSIYSTLVFISYGSRTDCWLLGGFHGFFLFLPSFNSKNTLCVQRDDEIINRIIKINGTHTTQRKNHFFSFHTKYTHCVSQQIQFIKLSIYTWIEWRSSSQRIFILCCVAYFTVLHNLLLFCFSSIYFFHFTARFCLRYIRKEKKIKKLIAHQRINLDANCNNNNNNQMKENGSNYAHFNVK